MSVMERGLNAQCPATEPRILADDIFLLSGDSPHLQGVCVEQVAETHMQAVDWAARFLQDAGSRISRPKSLSLASSAGLRKALGKL
eukprot:6732149-Alexandrium_andersonii.AAC.1